MAREKHIVDLTIGNFKRFADFEVKNLGQFNLIVGDNNTGKTSFLEALLLDEEGDVFLVIKSLASSIHVRSQDELKISYKSGLNDKLLLFFNRKAISNTLSVCIKRNDTVFDIGLRKLEHNHDIDLLSPIEKEKVFSTDNILNEFIFKVNTNVTTTLLPIQTENTSYFPFIAFGLGHDKSLLRYYSQHIDINKRTRDEFIERLQILIPSVNDVRVGNDVLNIYEEGIETPMPLFTYGEGANKIFRILCEIAICQGKRLMIDEIDAGIHHSRFKSFWRTIMQAAKAYDVQIFATTHNIECVDYFREVLEEETVEEYQDLARIVSLKVKKDNSVKASVYDFEAMKMANETDYELRGGGL